MMFLPPVKIHPKNGQFSFLLLRAHFCKCIASKHSHTHYRQDFFLIIGRRRREILKERYVIFFWQSFQNDTHTNTHSNTHCSLTHCDAMNFRHLKLLYFTPSEFLFFVYLKSIHQFYYSVHPNRPLNRSVSVHSTWSAQSVCVPMTRQIAFKYCIFRLLKWR